MLKLSQRREQRSLGRKHTQTMDDMQNIRPISFPKAKERAPTRLMRWVLGSAALFVCATLLYFYLLVSRPIGNGSAGPAVSREAFDQPWTSRSVLLVGLGDSITAGFGASKDHSYFERLVSNPPDEFPDMHRICLNAVLPNLRATNLSVSGSTSLEHVERQLPRLPVAGSNVLGLVVLTTGGNDIIHNYGRTPPREGAMYGATLEQAKPWIESFELRLNTIIQDIERRFPSGCQIFVANIYDPTDGAGDIERAGLPRWRQGMTILKAYNEILARCAQTHSSVHLVNLHDEFLGHGIHCTQFWAKHYRRDDPHYWYYDNLEDPNDRGYDAIRRLFLNEMAMYRNSFSRAENSK